MPSSATSPRSAPTEVADAAAGDPAAALSILVLDHLWLADTIARRFQGRGEEDDDLRQVARCGLIEAATRFDPRLGPFVSFASPTISGVIKRYFRDHGWTVRPPRLTQQLVLRMAREWPEIAQQVMHVPSDRDLATCLGEAVADIGKARCAAQGFRSASIDSDTASHLVTAMTDPEFERTDAKLMVEQAWRSLDSKQHELLRLRFWENRSQSDIAQHIGISQMQVSRLLTRTLAHIRQLLDVSLPDAA